MPHNGYRVFDNKKLKRLNVKISELKKYVKNYE